MTVTITHVWDDTSTGALSSYTLDGGAAFTPTNGAAYALAVVAGASTGTSAAPDITGDTAMGLNFVQVAYVESNLSPVRTLTVFLSGPVSGAASGSLVANFGGVTQAGCIATLNKIAGPGTWGAISTGVAQQVVSGDSDPSNVGTYTALTLATMQAGSALLAFFAGSALNGQFDPNPGTNTELSDVSVAGGRNLILESQWRASTSGLTAGVTVKDLAGVASTARVAGVLLEIVDATPPLTAVGKSLQLTWDVLVGVDYVVQVAMHGQVTAADLEPEEPPIDPTLLPSILIKIQGQWVDVYARPLPDA